MSTATELRPAPLIQGGISAAIAGVLVGASTLGTVPLALGILAVQVVLVLGFLALVDAPADGGAFVVAVLATLAADALVVLTDGEVERLAAVVALALVASLGHQLARRQRQRVTESIADTLVVVILAVAAVCLLALRAQPGGEEAVPVCLAAAAAALLGGRLGDTVAPHPALAVGSTRGWPGLLLALGGGTAAAVAVAGSTGEVAGSRGALLGLTVAVAVVAADLAVDLSAAELRPGLRDARRAAALRPVGLLLPFAALGPVAFVAGRLVVG
ncbi:MAG TPA: hypothetical protein VNA30_02435 [Mycobacteriales bacterium]|nr:hypothetical protein [Mycobacteriales bacterium]